MPTNNRIENNLAHEQAGPASDIQEFHVEAVLHHTQMADALEMPITKTAGDGAAIWSNFGQENGQHGRQRRIALVGTFTPRRCGVATFCSDVVEQIAGFYPHIAFDVYVLDDPLRPLRYQDVAGIIDQNEPASYLAAARRINESGADAVWLQHEYGIFGGSDGKLVCDFVEAIAPPLILTPHTILSAPSERQESILHHLIERASRIMVMSRHSGDLLASRYGVPHDIIGIIPHGAPDRPFGRADQYKARLDLRDKTILMTFGLLGPGKGLERVIEAMPAIVAKHPDTIYRVVGATHPNLIAQEGEIYRQRLQQMAEDLNVANHVVWENRYLSTEELLDQLEASDIYVTPYFDLQQSTSGTLSYAVALGKAVVSTPYQHALDLLAGDAGVLVEPDCAQAIASAVIALLDDRLELLALSQRAYAKGRQTIWPRFAEAAAALIESVIPATNRAVPIVARPSLSGVFAMSDGTGMLQHSIGVVPDRRHGYCLDDNARALMLMNIATGISAEERTRWSMTYASFIQYAWNDECDAFRNFMNFDRSWCEKIGSEDSNGRALWALGHTFENAPDRDLRAWAKRWYDQALPHCARFVSPHTIAFAMLGAVAVLRVEPDHRASREWLLKGGSALRSRLASARRPNWTWFEATLSYDNLRLPQALIEAGLALPDQSFVDEGLESLAWITQRQTSARGQFRPIGSRGFDIEYGHLPFDQQPLEAQAAIDAAGAAYLATGDAEWLEHGEAAWNWFLGSNDRGAVVGDPVSGRCFDGLNPRGANLNCGAESILAFQLSYYSKTALSYASVSRAMASDVRD
jgi:glycosyltransferase involved in cell wall biosynthesis